MNFIFCEEISILFRDARKQKHTSVLEESYFIYEIVRFIDEQKQNLLFFLNVLNRGKFKKWTGHYKKKIATHLKNHNGENRQNTVVFVKQHKHKNDQIYNLKIFSHTRFSF